MNTWIKDGVIEGIKTYKMEKKKFNDYPFWVQFVAVPLMWVMMFIKILIMIPIYVIGRCNDLIDNME